MDHQPLLNTGNPTLNLQSGPLTLRCHVDSQGKIYQKTENLRGVSTTYQYHYNSAKKNSPSRLLTVRKDNHNSETYKYDPKGRRSYHNRHRLSPDAALTNGELHYDATGKLIQAGDVQFSYDKGGNLEQRRDRNGFTTYQYRPYPHLSPMVRNMRQNHSQGRARQGETWLERR